MCTFYTKLPTRSTSAGTNKKRNLVVSLKPCADEKTYYRFRILAFSSDGKNDRDYPFITRFVHQIWGKNPEKGYPMITDEITCPVTPHVHVEGNRYQACKICDIAGKYFGQYKSSGYADKEAGRKNKEFSRKFQGIVPVYVVSDPNYEGNNNHFKVLIFNDKKVYEDFVDKVNKANLKNPVFNGEKAVDCCIHVSEITDVKNEGQPNEYKWTHRVIDKIVFSNKPYDIPSINKQTVSNMGFDEEYYTTSTPEEILAFYNKHCKVSNDDIPEDDEVPVYETQKPVVHAEVKTPVVSNQVAESQVQNTSAPTDDISDEDLNALTSDLDPAPSAPVAQEAAPAPAEKPAQDISAESVEDLLKGIDL